MNNDPTDDPVIPTSLPCPPWCQLPADHGFDNEYGGELHRSHEAATADFRFTRHGQLADVQSYVD